jgi:hypothetical protein
LRLFKLRLFPITKAMFSSMFNATMAIMAYAKPRRPEVQNSTTTTMSEAASTRPNWGGGGGGGGGGEHPRGQEVG